MKNIRKLVAVVIVAAMMLAVIPFTASAAASRWDGSAATAFNGGAGTETDPYIIASASQLAFLATSTNSGTNYKDVYFKLATDVDLAGKSWSPIGSTTKSEFYGNFDGAGHTISNMNCDTNPNFGGLFGKCIGATVKNVTVTGTLVKGVQYVGAIVGHAVQGTKVINCHSNVESIVATKDSCSVGGIVGRADTPGADGDNYIVACTSNSNIGEIIETINKNTFVGGIAGVAGSTNVLYCASSGNVVGTAANTLCVAGGIAGCIGSNSLSGTAMFNVSSCKVVAYQAEGTPTYAGGIVGRVGHVGGGYTVGNISTGEAATYENGTTTLVPDTFGGFYGHARNLAFVFNNYTTMDPACGYDAAGLDVDAAIIVEQAKIESSDIFNNIAVGDTLAGALNLFIKVALRMADLDKLDDNIEDFINLKVDGVDALDYVLSELVKEYDGSKELLMVDIITGLPTYSTIENALYMADNFQGMIDKAIATIEKVVKENVADATGGDDTPTTPGESDTNEQPSDINTSETPSESVPSETKQETPKETQNAPAESKGCASAVVSSVAVVVMAAAAAVVLKKKEN